MPIASAIEEQTATTDESGRNITEAASGSERSPAPVFAALNVLNLLGALVIVHAENGVFVDEGGYELMLTLVAGVVIVALLGAGSSRPARRGRPHGIGT